MVGSCGLGGVGLGRGLRAGGGIMNESRAAQPPCSNPTRPSRKPTHHHTKTTPARLDSILRRTWYSKNSSRTKRTTRQDLPTAVSPSSTSLKWHTLLMVVLGAAVGGVCVYAAAAAGARARLVGGWVHRVLGSFNQGHQFGGGISLGWELGWCYATSKKGRAGANHGREWQQRQRLFATRLAHRPLAAVVPQQPPGRPPAQGPRKRGTSSQSRSLSRFF